MRRAIVSVAIVMALLPLVSLTAKAQAFSSGSTGVDGPLNCTNGGCSVQLPDSGILNYTTINVSAGSTVSFRANLRNTPVILLAQGDVNINGVITVSNGSAGLNGGNQAPGPGGFFGGNSGQAGVGPGGGQTTAPNPNGKWIGPLSLVPIIGGSGGAGVSGIQGGGGGGALLIASSTSIAVTGAIYAQGGVVSTCAGSSGSGGAIRLVANSVLVSGSLLANEQPCSGGNNGVIRLESSSGSFTGTATPAPVISAINPMLVADSSTPTLRMISIAGYSVPANPAARGDAVDLLLPSQLTDPISVVVQGHNIPVGTQVSLNVSPTATATPANLAGTLDTSSATVTVSGISRTSVSTLFVFAIFNAPNGPQAFNPKGPNHVEKIRIEAKLGSRSKFAFLRANGSEIQIAKLSPQFRQQFGL